MKYCLLALFVTLTSAVPTWAATGTWTNYVAGGSLADYWTNNASWTGASHPGTTADSAYLTNQVGLAYTNLLNAKINNAITTLAISNTLGEAWLIITNTALTNGTFALNSGGRVQIDSGGLFRITSTVSWLGTNGTVYLNNGGQLISGGVTIGAGGGVTGLLTSTSGAGNGGVWNFGGGALSFGTGASGRDNYLRIANGVILTNVSGLTVGNNVGATSNTLIIAEGSQFFMNTASAILIGSAHTFGPGGSGNTVILSNSFIRLTASSIPLTLGWGSSNNTLTLLGDTLVDLNNNGIGIAGHLVNVGGTPLNFAYNNRMTVDGAVISNVGAVAVGWMNNIGGQILAISNSLEVINGGVLSNVTQLWVGGARANTLARGSDYNSLIVTGGGRLFMNGGSISVGRSGAGNNTLILSDSSLTADAASIGDDSSSNTVSLFNTIWNNQGANLTVGSSAATGNVLRVSNSLLTNFGNVTVGNNAGASGNQLLVENGSVFSNVTGLRVGFGADANNNTVLVTNGSRLVMNNTTAALLIGSASATTRGGNDNTLILSNSLIRLTASSLPFTIGWGSSNNTVTLLGDTLVDLNTNGIAIAGHLVNVGGTPLNFAYNNRLTVNGAVISNVGVVAVGWMNNIGGQILAISNSLEVINGGVLSNVTQLWVGGAQGSTLARGSDYNSLIVTGGGRLFMNGGSISVGRSGAGNNTLILSDSSLTANAASIGDGSSNNTVSLFNTVWNNQGANLIIGNNAATSNLLQASGSLLTNFNQLRVGTTLGADFNTVLITEGSQLVMTNAILIGANGPGGNGGNGNTVILSNSHIRMTGSASPIIVGGSSSNNTLILQANTTGDLKGNGIVVAGYPVASGGNPTLHAYNNRMLVDGAVITNVGTVTIGWMNSATGTILARSNRLDVVNGGVISNVTHLWVGGGTTTFMQGSSYNSLIVTGGGQLFMSDAGANFIVGGRGAGDNTVILHDSRLSANSAKIGGGSSNNTVTLANSIWDNQGTGLNVGESAATGNVLTLNSSLLTNIGTFLVGLGAGANGNFVLLTNGSLLVANTVQAGSSANNNSVLVTVGGILQANSLIIGAATTGNTISNRNGTYQFTNAPTAITSITPGDIALTDGTISFRTTGAANVATNASNLIRTIRYAGANTFTLNNASNTAAAVSQTYTFDAIAGNPSNFVNLVMVNGPTAYGNGNITIGSLGSMVVSNTTATINGVVTNHGEVRVVDAAATFQNAVLNQAGGLFAIRQSSVTVSGTLTNDGTLTFLNSVGTFTSAVVNRGAWITDPTTNVFLNSHTVTTNGYVSASAGDVFRFHNGLQNQSTNNVAWQTLNVAPHTSTVGDGTLFEFVGTSVTQTQVFSHPGLLLTGGFDGGPVAGSNAVQNVTSFSEVTGFQANFALGQLWLTNTTLVLTQAVAGAGALFVNDLFLLDPSNSRLVIANNMRLYFVNSNGWDMANITLLGNAEIHQLHSLGMVVIPEPSVLLLCLFGFVTVWFSRSRRTRREWRAQTR